MKTAMARPKTNTPAAQDAVTAEVEGAVAPATAPEAAALEGEENSPSLTPPDPDDFPQGSGLIVVVVAKQPIRWRIGRQFTPEQTRIPLDDLTKNEKAALIADPMLLVGTIEDI